MTTMHSTSPRSTRLIVGIVIAALLSLGLAQTSAHAITTWGAPSTNVDGGSNLSDKPASATSADGNTLIALWRGFEDSKFAVKYSVATVANNVQTWATPQTLYLPVSGSADFPQVAISADGTRATAVWSHSSQLYSSSATIVGNNATWGTPVAVGPSATTQRISLSRDGSKAFAVYLGSGSTLYGANATITGTTQTWETQQLQTTGRSANYPLAVLSDDGNTGTALWTEFDASPPSEPPNLASRSFTIQAGTLDWGPIVAVTPVDTTASAVYFPSAFTSADGKRVTAVWRKTYNTASSHDVESASATLSGTTLTWGTISTLDSYSGANIDVNPQVGGSANGGAATAIWFSGSGSSRTLQSKSATISGSTQSWGALATVGGSGSSSEYNIKVKVSDDGRTAVLAAALNGSVNSSTGQIDGTTSTWQALEVVSPTAANNVVTLGTSANALRANVVWANGSAGIQSVSGGGSDPEPSVVSLSPTSGPVAGGATLTIRGTYLDFATSVTVGGQACTGVVWDRDAQELTCTVPPGSAPGAVDVVVTAPGGISTVASGYTYTGDTPTGSVPNKPRNLKVSGTPTSKTYRITWKKPTQTKTRPVDRYRLTITQRGKERIILRKNLPSSRTNFKVTRAFLLKNSDRPRGDMPGQWLRYMIKVEALNDAGSGPVARTQLRLKI
ncbi:MAG: IPT/TIG domain-containing protein [Candidatus Nanopelagicales bacterium]